MSVQTGRDGDLACTCSARDRSKTFIDLAVAIFIDTIAKLLSAGPDVEIRIVTIAVAGGEAIGIIIKAVLTWRT